MATCRACGAQVDPASIAARGWSRSHPICRIERKKTVIDWLGASAKAGA